jgi:hypothetical protein
MWVSMSSASNLLPNSFFDPQNQNQIPLWVPTDHLKVRIICRFGFPEQGRKFKQVWLSRYHHTKALAQRVRASKSTNLHITVNLS